MAVASIIHGAQYVSINILSPLLCMINLRNNPIRWNDWIATYVVTY
jgi:hypothetical protein